MITDFATLAQFLTTAGFAGVCAWLLWERHVRDKEDAKADASVATAIREQAVSNERLANSIQVSNERLANSIDGLKERIADQQGSLESLAHEIRLHPGGRRPR